MIPFSKLLASADSVVLQSLIGADAVRLVAALDSTPLTPSKLRDILVGLHTPHELLCESSSRQLLLDLLSPQDASDLIVQLGVNDIGDPFRQLRQLSFRKSSAAMRILHAFFEVVYPESSPTEPSACVQEVAPRYALFPHQYDASMRVFAAISVHPHRVMLHMPTGSGKTRTAMHVVCDHLRMNKDAVVLWLAASEELCGQAFDEFKVAWSSLGNRNIKATRFWGANDPRDMMPGHDAMVVAGLQKLYARSRESLPWLAALGDRVTLVIFDEAHQAIAPTYRHVVDAITARREDTKVVGLSATPGRSWDNRHEDEELSSYFANRKVTLTVAGYPNPVHYLIAEQYLAKPSFIQLPYAGPTLTATEVSHLQNDLDVPLTVLQRLGADKSRNLLVVYHLKQLALKHQRIIVFCASVEQAILLTAVLNAQGLETRCVTAESADESRKDAIDWYRMPTNTLRILANYGVLTTGFDAPLTSAALIARPTKSLVLYSQMVGRAIRGPRAGGNRFADIATVVDTGLRGFGNVEDAFTNWEDVWQELPPTLLD